MTKYQYERSTKQTAGNMAKADDITTSSTDDLEKNVQDLEARVMSIERLLMRIIDKLELDYPGIIV